MRIRSIVVAAEPRWIGITNERNHMPLVQTIDNGWHLSRVFKECGRADAFSLEAFEALHEHYDERYESIELDVVGICCDWCEYDLETLEYDFDEVKDALAELRADDSRDANDPSDIEVAVHEAMSDNHFVISVGGGNWLVSA